MGVSYPLILTAGDDASWIVDTVVRELRIKETFLYIVMNGREKVCLCTKKETERFLTGQIVY